MEYSSIFLRLLTLNHNILLSKLKFYGIRNNELDWFKDYLTNRKQCISYGTESTDLKLIKCGVPQGSILGPLLFLIYINDLHCSSQILNFILFADDTNLFYSHSNIKILFDTVNQELKYIEEWFKANKLSLNINKTNYTLFSKPSKIDNLPLKLPCLKLNDINVKRTCKIKFLGVYLDETLSWRDHINILENKIAKNIGVLYKAKPYLNVRCLRDLYFSFIHSYLTYCNIAWGSTNQTKLHKLHNKQKHACRIIFGVNRYTPSQPILHKLGVLNIFQLNVHQVLQFMFKVKHGLVPTIFTNQFSNIEHRYNTRYAKSNFIIPKTILKSTTFSFDTEVSLYGIHS